MALLSTGWIVTIVLGVIIVVMIIVFLAWYFSSYKQHQPISSPITIGDDDQKVKNKWEALMKEIENDRSKESSR